ncbi:hypothetical protein GGI22_002989 [Coemansia erecta]|nr:hypothetical protein GGI22_002989 [Coemansia erecta]
MSAVSAEIELQQLPWITTPQRKGVFSMLRFWPRPASTKDKHTIELALLQSGGIAASTPQTAGATAPNSDDVVAELLDVDIDDKGNYIHTLAIRQSANASTPSTANASTPSTANASTPSTANEPPKTARHSLVMTHGYFTGLGYYFRNFKELACVDGWDVYAIDWLGMGRSARPAYTSNRTSDEARVRGAEAFFVESLEEWRKRVGIDKMTLCGHSFGGYMSALYALKYPERVEKLVLVSPIGLPEQPPDFDERLRQGYGPARNRKDPKTQDSTPEYESADVDADADAKPGELATPSRMRIMFFRTAMGLWERNYTPQGIVRTAGPFGRRLINWYVSRFSWLTDAQRNSLSEYAHQISTLPGSSEYALGDILRPGAFARQPLINRIGNIAVPTVFMYGENDWVDHTSGQQAMRRIGDKVATSLYRIPAAGHNLHLENPVDFNKFLIDEMRTVGK